MYRNLKAELVRYDITNLEIAERLNITQGTASLKVNGKAKVSVEEAFLLQDLIYEKSGKSISIEELFKA